MEEINKIFLIKKLKFNNNNLKQKEMKYLMIGLIIPPIFIVEAFLIVSTITLYLMIMEEGDGLLTAQLVKTLTK